MRFGSLGNSRVQAQVLYQMSVPFTPEVSTLEREVTNFGGLIRRCPWGSLSPVNQVGLHRGVGPSLDPFPMSELPMVEGGARHPQTLKVSLIKFRYHWKTLPKRVAT